MNYSSVLVVLVIFSLQNILAVDVKCAFKDDDCHNFTTAARQDCFACKVQKEIINDVLHPISFDLSNNPKTLNDIVRLDINTSNINYIPKNLFTIFPQLQFLYVYLNEGLTDLKAEYFNNGDKLNQFWAWNNQLTEVVGDVFAKAFNLQVVGLQDNEIRTIHKDGFRGLLKLEVIYMHNNLLKTLDIDTFKTNLKLRFISFANNRLKVLSFSTFSHLLALDNLILTKNACIDDTFGSVRGTLARELNKLCAEDTAVAPGEVIVNNTMIGNFKKLMEDLENSKQTRKILEVELLKTKNEMYSLEKFCKLQKVKFDAYKVKNCV